MTESQAVFPDSVEAEIIFAKPGAQISQTKTAATQDAGIEKSLEPHKVTIENGRNAELSLDVQGYELINRETAVTDFRDEAIVSSQYYEELCTFIQELTGATRTYCFDPSLRVPGDGPLQPRALVHCDFTETAADYVANRLSMSPEEAAEMQQHRFAIYHIWRPVQPMVYSHPLTVCNTQSMADADYVPHSHQYPDGYSSKVFLYTHNPDQQWHYFPQMKDDEVIVFKGFDSDEERACYVAHGAFSDPNTAADAPPRESIDVRVLAIFDE